MFKVKIRIFPGVSTFPRVEGEESFAGEWFGVDTLEWGLFLEGVLHLLFGLEEGCFKEGACAL